MTECNNYSIYSLSALLNVFDNVENTKLVVLLCWAMSEWSYMDLKLKRIQYAT